MDINKNKLLIEKITKLTKNNSAIFEKDLYY
jgi:hypothetical protein